MTDELEPILTSEYVDYMKSWSRRYLGRVRSTIHTVAMLRAEIDELAESLDGLNGIDYAADRVAGTASDDAMVARIARYDSLRAEYRAELDANLQWQADAHRALAHVRQPWRAVLTYRYLKGLPWADVAKAVSYSEQHCRTELHDNGLVELFPHIPHEYDELPGAI